MKVCTVQDLADLADLADVAPTVDPYSSADSSSSRQQLVRLDLLKFLLDAVQLFGFLLHYPLFTMVLPTCLLLTIKEYYVCSSNYCLLNYFFFCLFN